MVLVCVCVCTDLVVLRDGRPRVVRDVGYHHPGLKQARVRDGFLDPAAERDHRDGDCEDKVDGDQRFVLAAVCAGCLCAVARLAVKDKHQDDRGEREDVHPQARQDGQPFVAAAAFFNLAHPRVCPRVSKVNDQHKLRQRPKKAANQA